MYPLVLFQPGRIDKLSPASIACVRLDSQVGLQMSAQVVLLLESFTAVNTGKDFVERSGLVQLNMLVELVDNLKDSVAVRTRHFPKLFDIVTFLMDLQLILT